MATVEQLKTLYAPFPKEDISWRAQTVTKDGTSAMALAYIDARDVMERLDHVCGFEGWQDRYEFNGTKTLCYLSVLIGDVWVTKADGAGDTDIEADKGAISDAFKRAAVKWGIGRYLYDMPATWVPCESYQINGKWKWKRWTTDPWTRVKGVAATSSGQKTGLSELESDLLDCRSLVEVDRCSKEWGKKMKAEHWHEDFCDLVKEKFAAKRSEIEAQKEPA